ncbi:hypothetical protein FA13DRAFT_71707 [Coprinellus micaceus]|uniref:Uncharacterized protein n=1 Tax=Coprinellus micaceus TaxID=71717 RepID=A0A4Y7TKY9_COPMI|nr:hypothetical protein FA13DRAFT_71707 [Coprinellus micaceus]
MDEDDDAGEFLAQLFANGPTPDRQFDAGSPSEDANLPPLPSFFGVRTFSSTMTPETEVNSSLPPTAEEDKMDEDALPLLDRVAPSTTGTSLLSRIGPRKGGLFSAPLSLANVPPSEGASEPTPSIANAPPLGSTSAFPSSFSSFGSAPALGLYTSQQGASSGASTAATAPANWPEWGDWGAAWGGSAHTSASAPPTQAQPPILSTAPILTQAPSSPSPSLSPLELASAFWTSASANVGTDSPAREEPNAAAPDDSSSPESDYDSDDSSASSFWDSASDGEDDFGRNVKANGILTPPRATSSRNDRLGAPSRQSSMGTARVAPHIVLTLTLLRLKRDRSESKEFSDSSEDEGVPVYTKRQRRRYRAPGDTFVREQFRGAGSSPLSSPLLLPPKALPLPPARKQVFNPDEIDTTIDLFSDDLF